MNNYSYRVIWSDEDDCYVAIVPEVPNISGLGPTALEALSELHVALRASLEMYEDEGWPVPDAQHLQEYSGQFRLRLPRSVHARLAERAQDEGVSLNSLAAAYVIQGLAGGEVLEGVREASKMLADHYGVLLRSVTDVLPQLTSGAESADVGSVADPAIGSGSAGALSTSTTVQADSVMH
jgi:predicted RNase H-like HicB family nuclease